MVRKRKVEAALSPMDEADRTLYSSFSGAANSLSQLYTNAMAQQKLSFAAGERHALEKLYQWIARKYEEESRLTLADVVSRIQHNIEYGSSDMPPSPRSQPAAQISQHAALPGNPGTQPSTGFGVRASYSDQIRSNHFQRSLQPYQFSQGGIGQSTSDDHAPTGNEPTGTVQYANPLNHARGGLASPNMNDTMMDMISDSPNQY